MTGFSESAEYKVQQRAEVEVVVAFVLLLDRARPAPSTTTWWPDGRRRR